MRMSLQSKMYEAVWTIIAIRGGVRRPSRSVAVAIRNINVQLTIRTFRKSPAIQDTLHNFPFNTKLLLNRGKENFLVPPQR